MAGEQPGDASVSVRLPGPVRRWLDRRASRADRSREEVLQALVSTYPRTDGGVDEEEAVAVEPEGPPVDRLVAALSTELESMVDERLAERDGAVDEAELERLVEASVEALDVEGLVDEQVASLDLAARVDERLAEVDLEALLADRIEGADAADLLADRLDEGDVADLLVDRIEEGDLGDLLDGGVEEGELAGAVEAHLESMDVEGLVDEVVDERIGELPQAAATGEDGVAAGVSAPELEERLADLEAEFMDMLEDVRGRVVQLKRETDSKAPADHDHPDLSVGVEDVEGLGAELEEVSGSVRSVRERMDAGFENYEEVLEYVTDQVEEVAARQATLARAVVETRDELRKLAARDAARSAVEDLLRQASRAGVTKAKCTACDAPVRIGLLTRAECPHCSTSFDGVEPAAGFFGTNALTTGGRPALEPGTTDDADFETGVEDIIRDNAEATDE